jgi:hypothetical protein
MSEFTDADFQKCADLTCSIFSTLVLTDYKVKGRDRNATTDTQAVSDALIACLKLGKWGPVVGVLLGHLSNVETLELGTTAVRFHAAIALAAAYARRQQLEGIHSDTSLSQLRRVALTARKDMASLNILMWLFLPSLRTMKAEKAFIGQVFLTRNFSFRNVTTLLLYQSTVVQGLLGHFLLHFPILRKLHFDRAENGLISYRRSVLLQESGQAISHLKHSLEELLLLDTTLLAKPHPAKSFKWSGLIQSLQGFEKLHTVVLEKKTFGLLTRGPKRGDLVRATFSNILPKWLKKLALIGFGNEVLFGINRIIKNKKEETPNLEGINISRYDCRPNPQDLKIQGEGEWFDGHDEELTTTKKNCEKSGVKLGISTGPYGAKNHKKYWEYQ